MSAKRPKAVKPNAYESDCESCGGSAYSSEPDGNVCCGCGLNVCQQCVEAFAHFGDGEHGIGESMSVPVPLKPKRQPAALTPEEIEQLRRLAYQLHQPRVGAAGEAAVEAAVAFVRNALPRLLARLEKAEALLRIVLLFHKGGEWTIADGDAWGRIVKDDNVTTRALCDAIRAHLGARGKDNK